EDGYLLNRDTGCKVSCGTCRYCND
nr:RecName: Full=Neurotoxin-2; AltName: Full=BT-II; AltName: Full=Neurotoxin II [Mesobuthus tamulus]AAB31116.1 Bt-II=neurotoxin {N-terminal} [Buthus tamulus=indian scorpions, venom, Peptide Partial, 24 aa] [Mesobuthus tamulus]